MTLDESRNEDQVFAQDGVAFVIEKGLLGEVQPVTVDYIVTPDGEGFTITSGYTKEDGCGSCSC